MKLYYGYCKDYGSVSKHINMVVYPENTIQKFSYANYEDVKEIIPTEEDTPVLFQVDNDNYIVDFINMV